MFPVPGLAPARERNHVRATHRATIAPFAAFARATGYTTQAEREDAAAVFRALPPGRQARRDEWWVWTPGANWRHPEGPNSELKGCENEPVVHVTHADAVAYSMAGARPANLTGPQVLLAALGRRHAGLTAPRVVFASSIAVYGPLAPHVAVDEDTVPAPTLSYGTHKLMIELLLADLSRRGELDAMSLRLPGIVARPAAPTGHGSAFMSDLIRRGMAAEAYECPVSPQAHCWWMSLPACVDNLVHAVTVCR